MVYHSHSCLPCCVSVSSTLLLQLVLFTCILLLNICLILVNSVQCFQGSLSLIFPLYVCAFNDFTLYYLNISGYVSSVMLWNVDDGSISFVHFVSHCEPLCVYVVGEYIQLSLCTSGVDFCKMSL